MGLRTIDAPGVEIKEIDKSGYAPAMTGTKCFVMGYANKGEPYFPMEFTSKAAWQIYYGDPDNEAERYFYNACTEVINQNGVLYCARIPYDNKAYGKMVGFKYKVGSDTIDIPKAADYINHKKDVIYHNGNYEHDAIQFVIDNNLKRNIDYIVENDIEEDAEYKDFFNAALAKFSDKYQKDLSRHQRYSVQYYKLDTDKPFLSCGFYNEFTANNWLDENMPEDIEGKVKYKKDVFKKGDGDYWAMIFRYDYQEHVIDDGARSAILSDNWTEKDEDTLNQYTNCLTSLTSMIDDEIVKEEAVVFMNYLGDCPDHEFLSVDTNKFPDAKACTAKMYIDIIDVPNGFDYEDFVSTPVSKLYETLLKGSEEYSEAEYDELYQPYTLSNLLQIAAKSSRQNMRADGTKENVITRFEPYLSDFCDYDAFKNSVKVADLYNRYDCIKADVKALLPYYQVWEGDENIQKFIEITHSTEPVAEDLEKVDEYRTGESKVASQTFWVFDKTCARYQKVMEDDRKGNKRELLGLFPVVTTAANALYAQSLIAVDDEDVVDYESVESTITKDPTDGNTGFSLRLSDLVKGFNNENTDFTQSAVQDTVSREANNYFSTIAMNPEATGFDSENLKKIGVVVFKAFMDASEGNKVNFTPVEAFCGSLDKDAVNPNTKKSTFIDTLVNTQSEYIYLFSNCFANKTLKQKLNDAGVFIIKPGVTGMLGFYEDETAEEMSVPTLLQGIDKCFKNVEDINERDIDIIPDAGLANIAQYLYKIGGGDPVAYDLDAVDDNDNPLINLWKCQSKDDVSMWKTVQFKYDNFCKNVRKDCMFIADGPRPMVLQGQKKIVRPSKPTNTIDANILPYVKWATGLNTNYGAGYLDWFQIADEFTGDLFWCPPSIKAMGVYINTDVNFEYWDAPAGLNRGVVAALDTAFSPTSKQAGSIYTKNWNYAINYPYDGIVLEGQKTFQVKPSAFDRVNVRRLFLRLERQTNKVARYFVYEGNTAYTRQRLIDTLDPIFYQAKVGGGLYDYKIICDESINTPNVIDNNELRVKIGLKPIKSVEFILVDFVALGTGSSWSEM